MASNGNMKRTLDEVLPLAESLPLEDKAELVQRLIGEHSGLNVVIDNSIIKVMIATVVFTDFVFIFFSSIICENSFVSE